MIMVKSSCIKYLNGPFIGKLGYVLTLDSHGFEENESVIAESCSPYDNILIKHIDESRQEDKLAKLCVEIKKLNPYIKILVETTSLKKYSGVNSIKDLIFIVKIKLKNSMLSYNQRVNERNIEWYNKRNSIFLFNIFDAEELDEINMIVANTNIKKFNIYININSHNQKEIMDSVFTNSFNLYFYVDGDLFDN